MAIHTDLDIYKAAMELTRISSSLVSHMPRNHRSVDGALLVGHSRTILKLIRHANMAEDKVPDIDLILDEIVDVEVDLRVCVDLRLISLTGYARASQLSNSVHKQAHGWRKTSAEPKPVSRSSRRS
jgi:hypothetical protein